MAELKYADLVSATELTPKKTQEYFVKMNQMTDAELKSATKEILTQGYTVSLYSSADIKPEEVGDFIAKVQKSPNDMRNIIAAAYTSYNLGEMSNKADGIIDSGEQFAVRSGLFRKLIGHMRRFKDEQNQEQPKQPGFFQKAAENVSKNIRKIMFGPAREIASGSCDNVKVAPLERSNTQVKNVTRTSDPRNL